MREKFISVRPKESASEKIRQKKEEHLKRKFHRKVHINFGRFAIGISLAIFGIYCLAKNTGFLPSEFRIEISIWQLWPLLIVFAGLSMLSTKSKILAIIGSVLTFLIIFIIGYLIIINTDAFKKYSRPIKTIPFEIEKNSSEINGAVLDIQTNGSVVNIDEGMTNFIKGSYSSNIATLSTNSTMEKGYQKIHINTYGSINQIPTKYVNTFDLEINRDIPLQLDFRTKASKSSLNLSSLNLNSVSLTTDMTNLNLMLGKKNKTTIVSINAKTSTIYIHVPKTAGAKISSSSELSLENIKDLKKTNFENGKNIYQTTDFEIAKTKIIISLDLLLSQVNLELY